MIDEVTERLREDGPDALGLAMDEAICPSCCLAYFVRAGQDGVCRSCAEEPIGLLTLA